VAIARRSGNKWYIGGINAERTRRDFVLDLASLGSLQTATLIADGAQGNLSFKRVNLDISKSPAKIDVQGRGGFVIEALQR